MSNQETNTEREIIIENDSENTINPQEIKKELESIDILIQPLARKLTYLQDSGASVELIAEAQKKYDAMSNRRVELKGQQIELERKGVELDEKFSVIDPYARTVTADGKGK